MYSNSYQEFGNCRCARLGAEIRFAVHPDADGVGFHVALSNHEHGMHFHLFGTLDFAVDVLGGLVDLGADFVCANFVENRV